MVVTIYKRFARKPSWLKRQILAFGGLFHFGPFIIRSLMAVFLQLLVGSFLNIYHLRFDTAGDVINSILTCICLVLYFGIPSAITIWLYMNKFSKRIETRRIGEQYGILFKSMRTSLAGLLTPAMFFLRRIGLVAILFLGRQSSTVQILLLISIQFLLTIHLSKYRPLWSTWSLRLEIFNELCITSFLALLFTIQDKSGQV